MSNQNVLLEGSLLKPNMCLPGKGLAKSNFMLLLFHAGAVLISSANGGSRQCNPGGRQGSNLK
jgi:hypothetical protein